MGVFEWCTRRAAGLSIIALLALAYWVISREAAVEEARHNPTNPTVRGAGIWNQVFAYYSLLIHILVFITPIRAVWAMRDVTGHVKRSLRSQSLSSFKKSRNNRRGSYASLSSGETLTVENSGKESATSSEPGSDVEQDMDTDDDLIAMGSVIHAIIIPNYKEELDSLRETLDVLASHPQAQSSYDVYLGMEQREEHGESKALSLIQEFVKKFRSIDYTLHPSDIPGESPGKGSNLAWAARKLSANYSMEVRKNVIITGIDADSHLSYRFFASITKMHLAHPDTASTTLYSCPVIFDRNAHTVPALVRVADILWCAAGMSGLYTGSTTAPPTSVYALPLQLADRVGGWDADAEAIGEDLHMYIKCFFALNGNLTCRIVMAPVSQSNVTAGKGGGIRGVFEDVCARYNQAIRHMWGALDTGFAMRKFAEVIRERKHTSRAFRPLHKDTGEASDFYVPDNQTTDETQDGPNAGGIYSDVTQDTLKDINYTRMFLMGHRLFEAHFLPAHMTILVLSSALYLWVIEGRPDTYNLAWTFTLSNVLRTAGFLLVAIWLYMYETLHQTCVDARESEMQSAGLASGMCFSRRALKNNWKDYLMVPLVAPLFGAIPSAQVVICHFWTQDLVYTVSGKATRQRAKSLSVADMA